MAEGVATLTGRQKAAILCVSLGPAGAAEVFKHLREDQIEKLTLEMAKTDDVTREQADAVRQEALELAYARGYVSSGGMAYARDVLARAMGERRADEILQRVARTIDSTPFDFLAETPPDQIFTFLRHEHPQTVALVLANLPTPELAAQVLQLMPLGEQAEVATRIALMEQTSPEVVREVARVTSQKLHSVLNAEYTAAGGAESLAQILNAADRGAERNVLEHLSTANEELAEQVRALLFVFEDILKLDDRSVQLVLKEIDSSDLALALRGASEEVKQKIISNMSQRGAEMLLEEIEYMPPQRRRVVEEAQSKIVGAIRRLEDAGAIVIARGGADEELID